MKTRHLTFQFSSSARCDKCNTLIGLTNWRGQVFCFDWNKKSRSGFICVHCITDPRKYQISYYHSPSQLDNFIQGKPLGDKGKPPVVLSKDCKIDRHRSCRMRVCCTCDCHDRKY